MTTLLLLSHLLLLSSSASQVRAPQPPPPAGEAELAFREADLDGDGCLSLEEFSRALGIRDGRRAQAGEARLERRIAGARRELGAGAGHQPAQAPLALRLLDALERGEARLLGAGSRQAFAELRELAIGSARREAGGVEGEVAGRFLADLRVLEAKAVRSELTRADLDRLRARLGEGGVGERSAPVRGLGEARGPAEARGGRGGEGAPPRTVGPARRSGGS